MEPKVSVIIPTFNNINEIDQCINSILNQTYDNFEVIVVDDCSTDNTYEKLINTYSNHPKVIILKNEKNMKAAYTRNIALNHAKGIYIAVQDADDYSDKKRLSKQVQFLDNYKEYMFVGSNASSYDENGTWKRSNLKEEPTLDDFLTSSPFVHASIMFRKEVLDQVKGYRVSKEIERGQDYDLLIRLYKSGYNGYNLKEILYYYRETIVTVRKRNLFNRYKSVKNRLNYFPWTSLTLKQKTKMILTVVIGLIPPKLWYLYMKKKSERQT